MRYLILALLCLFSTYSVAQVSEYERKITCGDTKFVIRALSKEANERAIWVGNDEETDSNTVLMLNTKTLSWTVVQFDRKMACVLGSGTGFKLKMEDAVRLD